jgi:AcrR family transcriptional regulator
MGTEPEARRARADVVRNRRRILAAAQEAFEASGADASYEDIARRAGVGSATLYRHFPTRYALMEEVLRGQVAALCERGRALLDEDDPLGALRAWLREFLAVSAERGLAEALLSSRRRETEGFFDACHSEMLEVGASLLDRARGAGLARSDVQAADVLTLVSMIAASVPVRDGRPGSAPGRAEARRLLDLVIDGIR